MSWLFQVAEEDPRGSRKRPHERRSGGPRSAVDLPDRYTPEFPPPISMTTHREPGAAILSSKKTLMRPVTPAATRYDRTTIWIHWLTVALVAFQWLSANLIDEFAKGAPRMMAKSVHIAAGVIFLTLMLYRVFWRSTGGRRLPPADGPALHLVAKGTHWGLYALLFTTVGLGLLTAWAQGDSVFGLIKLPPLAPGDPGLGDRMQGIHGTFVNIFLILAAVHASAAVMHHLVWRDGVLGRMLPLGHLSFTAQPDHARKGRVTGRGDGPPAAH